MGMDIGIILEIHTAGGWRAVPRGEYLGGEWAGARSRDTFAFLTGITHAHDGIVYEPQIPDRGWPDDATQPGFDGPYGTFGHTWATVCELRALPWETNGLGGQDFRRWLHTPEMDALVAEHGADGVRVLMDFDN